MSIESTWKYLNELEKLKLKIDDIASEFHTSLNESKQDQEKSFLYAMNKLREDVSKTSNKCIEESKKNIEESKNYYLDSEKKCLKLLADANDISRAIQSKIDYFDKEKNQKDIQLYNTLEAYKKQVENLYFDIVDNEDNIAISYSNPDGKHEHGFIKKIIPDNKTLQLDKNNKLSFKYKFDNDSFNIIDDNITVTGLILNNNTVLSGDRIKNDLNNAMYNVNALSHKVEAALLRLNNVNGYIASNNFKKSNPEQATLTNFVIECLSNSNSNISIDEIPAGTKIKNTFDNHIWVLNRIVVEGLVTHKWEDFGSDTICIANNDGIHGLVTGSNDHFKAFIDINGVMSINGLEEDFQDLLNSLNELNIQLKEIQSNYNSKLDNLEMRVKQLEKNG